MKAPNADNKPGRIADLPPDQLALLMLKLREKASSRADKEPRLADIRPVPRDGNIPLSFAQQRLWFIDQLQPGSPAYNTPIALRMAGPLDAALLQRSLSALMQRHEILRTSFPTVAGQPIQAIAPAQAPPLPLIDLRALPAPEREDVARRLAEDAARQPFDLAHGPLLRATVLRLDAAAHVVLLTTHHIICDGWSTPILMRELNLLYDGFATGKPAPLPELPVQYADFAVWQRAWLQGAVLEEQLAYWKAQLADLPTLELPTDYPRPAVETFRGALQGFELPAAVSAGLATLSRQAGTTMFMTVLAAWKLLLARYSGQDDIVVGTPIAGRRRAETEELIGFFINTLVLRADLSGNPAFSEALGRVRKSCLGAYAHQDLPFEQVVEALQPARDLSRHPLFQVMFALHNEKTSSAGQAGTGMRPLEIERGTTHFDLSMSVEETGAGLVGSLEYRTDLFAPSMITRMLEHFQTLLEGIAARPALPIAALPLLNAAERQQLLVAWNATQAAYPHDQCLHQLFEAQTVRTPDVVAVVFDRGRGSGVRGQPDKETRRQGDKETRRPKIEDRRSKIEDRRSSILHPPSSILHPPSPIPHPQHLTYHELNRRANQLAHHLRSLGVGPEVRVGICLERSLDLLVGLLGVLKAGAAYVPLDPAYPAERLAFMLEDAEVPVLITTTGATDKETRGQGDKEIVAALLLSLSPGLRVSLSVVDLRADWEAIAGAGAENLCGVRPAHAAYAIYTSGSTGRPKGVLVSHQALVNYTLAVAPQFRLRDGDRMLQFASLSFDVLIEELFPAWARGATVVLHGAGLLAPAGEFGRMLDQAQVSVVELPAAYWHAWVDELARSGEAPPPALRLVLLGCEKPQPDCLARWRQFGVPLVYVFGLTETAITSTLYHVPLDATGEMELPIGRPVANTQIYVLDAYMQPAPIGVPGELYIGGDGLARCYLGRPDLTAERFVPNPFLKIEDRRLKIEDSDLAAHESLSSIFYPLSSESDRLYKTGDLARYRPDGNLEFLGRRDEQVKLRGFRVELGEIEAALVQHPDVREAVVVAREGAPGDVRLVAYVVPKIEDRGLKIEDSGSDAPEPLSSILYPLSSELRAFLQSRLPDYMVPAAFVALDALPLTPSGKVDRRALPAPDGAWAAPDERYLAPRTPIEEVLAQLWTGVLRLERVGAHDDFFALGGHSLLATQVIARVREAFQVELPLRSLFERPRLADLAEEIARARRAAPGLVAPPLLSVARDRALPLSFAQQRLWVIDQLQPQSPAYNVPAAMRLTGPLVVSALQQSLSAITRRHEVLRTTFALVGEQPAQLITPPRVVPLPLLDLRTLPAQEREAAATRLATAEAQRPFDLAQGPLLRASVLRLDDAEHVALLTMHHIVADAWSIEILVRELAALYSAAVTGRPAALPELPVQYADYAVWQRAWLQGPGVRGQGSGRRGDKETRRQGDKETP